VDAGGTELSGGSTPNTINLNNAAGDFTANQAFTFNIESAQGASTPVVVTTGFSNATAADAIANLNSQLATANNGAATGITASIGSDGTLQFSGSVAFSVLAGTATPLGSDLNSGGLATAASYADTNSTMYSYDQATAPTAISGTGEIVQVTNSQGTVNVTLNTTTGASDATAIAQMNTQLNSIGIYAVANNVGSATGGFTLQSNTAFTLDKTQADAAGAGGNFFGPTGGALGAIAVSNPASLASGAADTAITAIANAVSQLGLVQGRVGAGENQLNYAISLATSQLTNFTSAESQIRDANVAQEAANLTKAQVLQQSSIAAMAQANSAPQQYLALLKT
jgi:flagellin